MLPFARKLIYDGTRVHLGRGACSLTRPPAYLLAITVIGLGGGALAPHTAHALAPSPVQWVSHEQRALPPLPFSLKQAVAKVRREVAGRILSARTVRDERLGGRTTHLIKVLTPRGRVIVIRIDAQTGKRLP